MMMMMMTIVAPSGDESRLEEVLDDGGGHRQGVGPGEEQGWKCFVLFLFFDEKKRVLFVFLLDDNGSEC